MPSRIFFELRLFNGAVVHRDRAAGVETASARWIERAGDIACKDDPLTFLLYLGIGNRDGGEKSPRVGMKGFLVEPV